MKGQGLRVNIGHANLARIVQVDVTSLRRVISSEAVQSLPQILIDKTLS
jgi:hypothetical protein